MVGRRRIAGGLDAASAAGEDDGGGGGARRRRWRRATDCSASSMSICSCLQSSLQKAASPLQAADRSTLSYGTEREESPERR